MTQPPDASPPRLTARGHDTSQAGSAAGDRVGRFVLAAHLGDGGLGTVWRARDTTSGASVALKRLHPDLDRDPRLRRRLQREIRAVQRLNHPHVVPLLEAGETPEGSLYFVMPLAPGQPFGAWAAAAPSLGAVEAVFDQLLQALEHAHRAGVVHRDLGPGNVLVADARPRHLAGSGPGSGPWITLLDFGFAWVEDDVDEDLTRTFGDRFGQPRYMAPEQVAGETEVGPAADLYSVAVLLWEVLTGAPPFDGPNGTAVLMQHLSAVPPVFTPRPAYARQLPSRLETFLRHGLGKRPDDRFGDAARMRRALHLVFRSGAG